METVPMSESASFDRVILKILNGIQAGAEVALAPGEYKAGSGAEDDIQFVDVSLKPAHVKLRVAPTKLEIAGGSGSVTASQGVHLEPGSEWQEIEPLEIITVGMVRFVLGPPNANWMTLTEGEAPPKKASKRSKTGTAASAGLAAWLPGGQHRQLILPIAALAAVLLFGAWFFAGGHKEAAPPQYTAAEAEKIAREALDQFPFGKQISLRREPDGTVYATGFVKDGYERRALVSAIEKARVPVYFRLGVLEALRNEIDGLIKAEKVPVTFVLSPSGELTLEGTILNEDSAGKFVSEIKGAVAGLTRVDSKIHTAKTLLDDIQKLGKLAQIDPFVLLRLDSQLIEANGILPIARIDAWVGFLQSYSRRFSKEIGLRSFVQLQRPDGSLVPAEAAARPVVINGPATGNEVVLDAERLLRGQYKPSDMFAVPGDASATLTLPKPSSDRQASDAPPKSTFSASRLAVEANRLITSWRNGLAGAADEKALISLSRERAQLADDCAAGETDQAKVAEKCLPLLPAELPEERAKPNACRPGSRLTPENIPMALFWLDLLSASATMSLSDFNREEQAFILEVALDPTFTRQCLEHAAVKLRAPSVYLSEAARNPDFVRFVTRKFQAYPLDISGASVTSARYIQTRDGQKFREGGSPDSTSRISTVGELGAAVEVKDGISTVIYRSALNWLNQK
jgi:type III secretion system YscD/HrpQ family protein